MGSLHDLAPVAPVAVNEPIKIFALYQSAKQALAECVSVIEVEQVIASAESIAALSKIAGDLSLEINAIKLRFDAERRLGQMLKAQKETAGMHKGGRPTKTPSDTEGVLGAAKLGDVGISYKKSSITQKYSDLTDAGYRAQKEQWEEDAIRTGRPKRNLPCAAEKPRKKAPVIEHKEEAEIARFDPLDAPPSLEEAVEMLQAMLAEAEQNAAKEKEEKEAARAEAAKLAARLEAFENNAKQTADSDLVEKISALEAENTALKREFKALETRFHQVQSDLADRQKSLNWYKEEYKKVCKATGYERPKKTSTYCTGTGYSDPNDPRAKPLPPMEGAPQKDLAQQLAQEKAAVNQQKKEANAWLEQNNLPADDGYQFSGKQAAAQATREKFADKRPKAEPASEERGKIDWKAMGRNHGNHEAQQRILADAGYDYYNPPPGDAINGWGDLAK